MQRWPLTRTRDSPLVKGVTALGPACSVTHRALFDQLVGLASLLVQLDSSKVMRVLESREARPKGNPGSQFQSPQSLKTAQIISLSDSVLVKLITL